MERGTVKFFNTEKGFGFIRTETGADLFFHISQRNPLELGVPNTGAEIFFERQPGRKGEEAGKWQLTPALAKSRPVALEDQSIDPEQDRRDGYRPGVMIALRKCYSKEILLGRRRGAWTFLLGAFDKSLLDAPNWMYSWGVPQGGIEENETCEQAIRRELTEELGDYTDWRKFERFMPDPMQETGWGWADCITGEPKFLFKERSAFRVEKDGKTYKGKTLYAFVVDIESLPYEADEWMYGDVDEEPSSLPCPGFEGGALFYSVPDAIKTVQASQKGPKGEQLVRLLEMAHVT